MRRLLLTCSIIVCPVLAAPRSGPARATPLQGPTPFEILISQTPLAELAPVPFSTIDEQVHREVDEEICAAYRRWRATPGNGTRDTMEAWCPTRK